MTTNNESSDKVERQRASLLAGSLWREFRDNRNGLRAGEERDLFVDLVTSLLLSDETSALRSAEQRVTMPPVPMFEEATLPNGRGINIRRTMDGLEARDSPGGWVMASVSRTTPEILNTSHDGTEDGKQALVILTERARATPSPALPAAFQADDYLKQDKDPVGKALAEIDSRSRLRRIAAQKGEPAPEFPPNAAPQARPEQSEERKNVPACAASSNEGERWKAAYERANAEALRLAELLRKADPNWGSPMHTNAAQSSEGTRTRGWIDGILSPEFTREYAEQRIVQLERELAEASRALTFYRESAHDAAEASAARSATASRDAEDAQRWRTAVEQGEFPIHRHGVWMHVLRPEGRIIEGESAAVVLDRVRNALDSTTKEK